MEPRISLRSGVGISAGILQQQELEFKRLFIDQPVLIFVEHGIKSLRWSNGEYLIHPGEAIAIAGGQSVDITNSLADDGSYRAHWLVWDRALITAHAERYPDQPVIRHALPIIHPSAEFGESFRRALTAVEDAGIPLEVARHRVAEMLLWIGMYGGRFAQGEALTLTVKLRRLIGQELARDWSAAAIAAALAMSEATMRRKLAAEGCSLSEILADARMSFALKLLQSTIRPVSQIAFDVGYPTPSHFAVSFRKRFGFPPSAIRRRPGSPL